MSLQLSYTDSETHARLSAESAEPANRKPTMAALQGENATRRAYN